MKIPFSQICRDYLALRGESPGLLPLLEEEEESAVLPIALELEARLLPAAEQATLALMPHQHDELRAAEPTTEADVSGALRVRLPDDYLRLHALRMTDWREPLTGPEPSGSLRRALGAHAPAWMICQCHPMVTEEADAHGSFLKVYGSQGQVAEFLYVPRPSFNGETLTISRAAYRPMLQLLL